MIKCLLLDFDGVIVDSVAIKTNAFAEIFKGYPKFIPAIIDYQQENGGISRMLKFKHIYGQILKKKLSQSQLDQLCNQFSELVKENVIAAPFIKGAEEFLEYDSGKYPMCVISGTPEKEMREIVRKRGLEHYFGDVYGSPKNKAEIIRLVQKKENCSSNDTLFIGDSVNDFSAAMETKVRFVAKLGSDDSSWVDDPRIEYRCHDLAEFQRYLEKIS